MTFSEDIIFFTNQKAKENEMELEPNKRILTNDTITYDYYRVMLRLNWFDLNFAIENDYLSHVAIITHASFELEGVKSLQIY